jgi:hypothetical protein
VSAKADNSYIVMSSTDSIVQENVDIKDLKDIFLGHRVLWRNGDRIFPAHIRKTSSYMNKFLESVLSMSPRQYNKYWRRRLFSGKGHPPVEFNNDDKVLSYVQKTEGAIAIISKLPKKKYTGLHFFQPVSDGLNKVE